LVLIEASWPDSIGTFDLFGIDENSYTYLLSKSDVNESDVKRSAIISTREKHILTYEIFASGFPKATARIALDLEASMPPRLTNAQALAILDKINRAYDPENPQYPSTSYLPPSEIPDSIPNTWPPKIWILDPTVNLIKSRRKLRAS
jgi:hypothetical protein